ncbi:MAG TPA: MFS transporter [Anaerolineaceae bacterium]|nr:MFS transporter [Anaerolineaceae bacterium]HPN51283.1 MFS transporter [Anaerolineaceae bacterium]
MSGFQKVLVNYGRRLAAFSPNARLYLISAIISGAALGVYRLLFNFFVLSQGYDETLLGNLVSASSLTSLLAALPMGYLADSLGRKRSLVIGAASVALAVLLMTLFPSVPMFISMNVLLGLAQSLSGVSMSPFLMENSKEEERTYLFSFSVGLQMISSSLGNWIGGYMPTWFGLWQNISSTGTEAYRLSLMVVACGAALALLPLVMMKLPRLTAAQRTVFAPIEYARKSPGLLAQLITPMFITGIGAGLFMPFMNVFFRNVHQQSDAVIGTMFAWGALAMGIGLMAAPPLADRVGKIQLVVLSQALSIPFLVMLGFSPIFGLSALAYYMRLGLMNMSGPVYQTFVMEKVDPSARATVASLVSMASNFGWAFCPSISGWIQVNYGFGPVFAIVIVLYLISTCMYWWFFWRQPR